MSYFEYLGETASRLRASAQLRYSYNSNSGGGQSFLAGRYYDAEGDLQPLEQLENRNVSFQFVWTGPEHGSYNIELDDPKCKYEIKRRSKDDKNMKLEIGTGSAKKISPSRAISTFLMFPETTTVKKSEDIRRSSLSSENYWLESMPLAFQDDQQAGSDVNFSPKELIFAGGIDKNGNGQQKYFKVDSSRRISDIVKLAESANLADDIVSVLEKFASVYRGELRFKHEECETWTKQIMAAAARDYPDQYSGIMDVLPVLMEMSRTAPSVEVNFVSGLHPAFSRNRISFGAPGTGKSYMLNEQLGELLASGGEFERVTFHPDYSYAHFVGTYKPVPVLDSDGREVISYKYVPGPFMRVLVSALRNSSSAEPLPFVLLIEEINRSNASSVFGEIFQLLDRGANGSSEYSIHPSEDVRNYLAEELKGSPSDFSELRLPDNMFIWATMNSADQGVFPLDTAFKRRWDFSYVGVNDNELDLIGKTVILGERASARRVEWNSLRRSINDWLSMHNVNEDKQLGPYFLAGSLLPVGDSVIDPGPFCAAFKSKVIMYLFEDAARPMRSSLFSGIGPGTNRYSDICRQFDRVGILIFNQQVVDEVESADVETDA